MTSTRPRPSASQRVPDAVSGPVSVCPPVRGDALDALTGQDPLRPGDAVTAQRQTITFDCRARVYRDLEQQHLRQARQRAIRAQLADARTVGLRRRHADKLARLQEETVPRRTQTATTRPRPQTNIGSL